MKIQCVKCNRDMIIFSKNVNKDTAVCNYCKHELFASLVNWSLPKENIKQFKSLFLQSIISIFR